MKNADSTALVLVPVALAIGLWATLEAFDGIDSDLANSIEQLLATNYELAGMFLILLVIGWLLASDGGY